MIPLPLNLYLYIPTAPSVPMTVERIVLTTAMIIVFPNDSSKDELLQSFIYQSNENPFQLRYGFVVVALNELATTTNMGRNKNRYTIEQKATLKLFFLFSFLAFLIRASYTPRLSISPPSF